MCLHASLVMYMLDVYVCYEYYYLVLNTLTDYLEAKWGKFTPTCMAELVPTLVTSLITVHFTTIHTIKDVKT